MPVVRRALVGLALLAVPARAGAAPVCEYVSGTGAVDADNVASPCLPYDGDTTCVVTVVRLPGVETVTLTTCYPASSRAQQSTTT